MTHYKIISIMPREFHDRLEDDLRLLNKIIPNHKRIMKIYEVVINNENEKEFEDKFLSGWNTKAKDRLETKLLLIALKLLFPKHKVSIFKKFTRSFNMRNYIFKFKDKYKKEKELL